MFGLSLGGAQQWARPLGGSDDPFMQQQRQPATGSDGSLYLTAMGGANGWSLFRVDPANGNVVWDAHPRRRTGCRRRAWGRTARSTSPEPRVPRLGDIDRPAALDLLRRLDHRPSRGEPRRQRRRRRGSPNFGQPDRSVAWNAATGTLAGRSTCRTRTAATRSSTRNHGSRPTARPPTSAQPSSAAEASSRSSTPWAGTRLPPATTPRRTSASCLESSACGSAPARTKLVAGRVAQSETSRASALSQVGFVLAQSPAAGTTLPLSGRVNFTVGRR